MQKEFVPYKQSLELKEVGFDEPCFGYYDNIGKLFFNTNGQPVGKDWVWEGNQIVPIDMALAPLYQQAFRWFREKYGLSGLIEIGTQEFSYQVFNDKGNRQLGIEPIKYNGKYEEAELECLNKLIELIKTK